MIETRDLGKQFSDFWAVDGVDLHVGAGQVLALLGQNGAGKTTTVRMLSALIAPSRGTAQIAGHDVVHSGPKVRQLVGVLTEQHGLYGRMSAEEYLEFYGRLHGLKGSPRATRIRHLLESFGLGDARRQRIGTYSKGMRQKLALARALIHEPPVLLLDEPTSAMDPESARLVRDEIASLRSAQRSIVICTHNLAEAEALADVVAIIYQGRILVQGTLADLRREVLGAAEYEARLASPWIPDSKALPEGATITRSTELTIRFGIADPLKVNPGLLVALGAMQAPLVAFQEVPQSLETIYLQAMQAARLKGASDDASD